MNYQIIVMINLIFKVLYMALFIRVILSWVPHNPNHPLISLLYRITEPMLRPFQNLVPSWKIGIDLAPIFAFLALSIIQKIVISILIN
ncbi:MAG: YggT family protein [Candidatus Margulisbacteria bacterium]|nr:YggT family protein [Candidatus Margulisiibacteriota bacterium]